MMAHRSIVFFVRLIRSQVKIVINEKGLYAIRKGIWPFYKYFDLRHPTYRCKWKNMELIGHAVWLLQDGLNDEGEDG